MDVVSGGLETLGAASDVMILGAGFTGPLAPVLLGAGVVLKGITKTGKAILKTKKGKTLVPVFDMLNDWALDYIK